MDTVPCVVSMDTARYYNELDKQAELEELVDAYIDETIDELLYRGKLTWKEWGYPIGSTKGQYYSKALYLYEIVYEYITEECDAEGFAALTVATTFGDDREAAQTDLDDYIRKACEWYYKEMRWEEMQEEYLKTLED